MTKLDLIEKIAEQFDITRKEAELAVNAFFSSIKEALDKGDRVELRGFGVFKVRNKKERMGRNPRTGEVIHVPAKLVPYFKPSKELKKALNFRES